MIPVVESAVTDASTILPDVSGLGTLREIAEAGYTGAHVARRHGGGGLNVESTSLKLEELGLLGTDAGLAFSAVTSMASTGVALSDFGTERQQMQWLPGLVSGDVIGAHAITEELVGSDALNMSTQAVRDGESWVLTGSKTFVTNGGLADVYVVYARTSNRASPLGLSAFLVPADTAGLTPGPPLETMGLEASPVTTLVLDGCRLGADALIGRVGGGFLVLDHVMQREIIFSFMFNVGEMERRVQRCVSWARDRQQFGQPISAQQAVSHRLAEMRIQVDTARMWLIRAAQTVDSGRSATLDVSIAKVIASRAHQRTAQDAVQVFGGRGYLKSFGLERDVRNSLAGSIYSGTNEIQLNRIASVMGLR
jgi:acyl-coA dehydrogenase domain-containing protein